MNKLDTWIVATRSPNHFLQGGYAFIVCTGNLNEENNAMTKSLLGDLCFLRLSVH